MRWTTLSSLDCKLLASRESINADRSRIDNDDKLREKVDEALTVYDEYVKNAGGDNTGSQDIDGKHDEPPTETATEEVKA